MNLPSLAIKTTKRLVLAAAKRCGVLELIRDSKWRSQRLLILCYHGISIDDEHEWNPTLYLPQELFRERLRMLQAGEYVVLPLDDAVRRLYAGQLPPRAVALTFDDGGRDFRLRAAPVLAEFGYPATVYVTTYYSVHRYPIFNLLFSYLLWKGRRTEDDLSGILPGQDRMPVATPGERALALQQILDHVRQQGLTNDQQTSLARRLADRIGVDYDHLCEKGILHIMCEREISELAQFNVAAQLHTHRHRSPEDEALFRREIRENREHLSRTGLPPDELQHFCYPSGRYKPQFFPWLEAENVRTATTCEVGLASNKTPPLLLPRLIDTCYIGGIEFEGWLSGASHLLPRRS